MKFVVRLKKAHEEMGLSPYAVWKKTGIAKNTILKYVGEDEVIAEKIEIPLIRLAQFYGVDWRDPSVIDIITEADK